SDGNVITAFKTLKSFEEQLPKGFVRIHQSYILNSRDVSRINYGKSICTLNHGQGEELPFSKTYKDRIDLLKELLSKNVVNSLNLSNTRNYQNNSRQTQKITSFTLPPPPFSRGLNNLAAQTNLIICKNYLL